ncbi:MAG: YdbL family protein [Thermodesulfobacteriota bacterium]
MFNIYRKLAVICVLLVLLCAATAVQAQDKDQVVQSMKDRHPDLQQAKDQGLVGEAWNGLVAVVQDDVPQEIQELVQAENKDRKQLFKIISQETGTSVQEVARQNRIRMYRLAKDDHFLQDQDRNWVRKKEL